MNIQKNFDCENVHNSIPVYENYHNHKKHVVASHSHHCFLSTND
jgi:hypothetical protein